MEKYRIKTEKEFKNEFGELWRSKVKYTFAVKMDKYFGVDLSSEDNIVCKKDLSQKRPILIFMGIYSISEDMIIMKNSQSSSLNLNSLLNDDLKIMLQQNN